jgi:hypothetical protein
MGCPAFHLHAFKDVLHGSIYRNFSGKRGSTPTGMSAYSGRRFLHQTSSRIVAITYSIARAEKGGRPMVASSSLQSKLP